MGEVHRAQDTKLDRKVEPVWVAPAVDGVSSTTARSSLRSDPRVTDLVRRVGLPQ
jgi:hypothetical protein